MRRAVIVVFASVVLIVAKNISAFADTPQKYHDVADIPLFLNHVRISDRKNVSVGHQSQPDDKTKNLTQASTQAEIIGKKEPVNASEREQRLLRFAQTMSEDASRFFDDFVERDQAQQSDPGDRANTTQEQNMASEAAPNDAQPDTAFIDQFFSWLDKSNEAYQREIVRRLQIGEGLVVPPPDGQHTKPDNPDIIFPSRDKIMSSLQSWFDQSSATYNSEIIKRIFGDKPSEIVLKPESEQPANCLLYTSDAADD